MRAFIAGVTTQILVLSSTLFAQKVQWASELIDFSSEPSAVRSAAKQVLGRPNVLPAWGLSPNAWNGKSDGNFGGIQEFIKVGFANPMQIQQVAIAENYNPGAVEKVVLYDINDNKYTIFEGEPQSLDIPSRVMAITFIQTAYKVKAVEIYVAAGKVPGINQIDAIAISDSKAPIKVEPNLPPNLSKLQPKENLGRNINSVYDDVFPVISPDGKTLYFDRKFDPRNIGYADNIWYSTIQNDGSWGPARNVGKPLNNGNGTYAATITPDGSTMLLGGSFYDQQLRRNEFGIWMSTKTKNGWGDPKRVIIDSFYTRHKFMEFCLGHNGKVLILSLQRDDSNGDRDLYVSFLRDNDTWTAPLNMGSTINSLGNEATPFLASDMRTLYFGSDGFSGYGSSDIYVSRRLDDSWTNWSEPLNLGPDINTKEWDSYYTIPASGEYGYLVSYQNTIGAADIFRIPLPPDLRPTASVLITGRVFDKKTNASLDAVIRYEILPGGKEAGIARTDPQTGEYKIVLPAGALYGFRAEVNGYIPINENIDLKKTKTYTELQRDLAMAHLEVGAVVRLNNIFFETGKYDLKEESFAELDRLLDLLKSNSTMELQINGHTDNVGAAAANMTLSENRAKSVMNYLVKNGIASRRLMTNGYGQTKPVASNATEEGRQANRRVEFIIVKQ